MRVKEMCILILVLQNLVSILDWFVKLEVQASETSDFVSFKLRGLENYLVQLIFEIKLFFEFKLK